MCCYTLDAYYREVMLGEQKELEKAKGKKGGKGSKNKSKRFPDKPTADVSCSIHLFSMINVCTSYFPGCFV